jgi:Lung seven transmembrane receptor
MSDSKCRNCGSWTDSIATLLFVSCWYILSIVPVQGGFVDYELVLEPTAEIIRYSDGYIRAPGFIDLGSLTFTALSAAMGSDTADDEIDDPAAGDGGGTRRYDRYRRRSTRNTKVLTQQHVPHRTLDGKADQYSTAVDIVIFRLPQSCAHKRTGCDWAELGVGKRIQDGALRWCCNDEAVELGLCKTDATSYGQLMIDEKKFNGNHRVITIPLEGAVSKQMKYGKMEEKESGTYVVLFANCNERGREMFVQGESVWKSIHGYLPGELYGFMYFYTAVAIVYFLLWVWYGFAMKVNQAYRIEIEKWVMLAISLGLLEMIFRTGDYFVWNSDGYRSSFIIWIGVLAGVLKQGISRCLMVMVSLGWGVVNDSLGSTMRIIIFLGAAYIIVLAVCDLMIIFALEDINILSNNEEIKIFTLVRILTLVLNAINVIFILWILDALNNTVFYLETMNQSRKLERYNKFRCLFMFSILFAVVRSVFELVDSVDDEGLIAEEHAWAIDAATEINYLFVLVGVAFLWKPNPNAQEYAYVMELPSMGTDGENELELTGVVPSAADSDDGSDDFNTGKNGHSDKDGFHDESEGHDGRFQIS